MLETGTIGNTDKCKNVTQNSHNNNIYNLVNSLGIKPQEVNIDALVHYRRLKLFVFACSIIAVIFIMKYFSLPSQKSIEPFIELFMLMFLSVMIYPTLMSFFTLELPLSFVSLFLGTKVKYKNQSLIYNGISRKFYNEIWDMQYKKHFFGKGATLTIYVISEKNKIPYRDKIVFAEDAKAKYVHDSFWNVEKIEEFKKRDQFSRFP